MFKTVIVCLSLCAIVLAETRFEPVSVHRAVPIQPKGVEVSHPSSAPSAGTYAVPPDNGGNYGDNLWRTRVSGDVLLTREIQINNLASTEQAFNWNGNFPGKSITHIRFLNIGRQRAWVESITANGGSTASALVRIAPNFQFRLLIEVYGR